MPEELAVPGFALRFLQFSRLLHLQTPPFGAHNKTVPARSPDPRPQGGLDRANRSVAEMVPCLATLGLQPGQTESEALKRLDQLLGPDGPSRGRAATGTLRSARSLKRPVCGELLISPESAIRHTQVKSK